MRMVGPSSRSSLVIYSGACVALHTRSFSSSLFFLCIFLIYSERRRAYLAGGVAILLDAENRAAPGATAAGHAAFTPLAGEPSEIQENKATIIKMSWVLRGIWADCEGAA